MRLLEPPLVAIVFAAAFTELNPDWSWYAPLFGLEFSMLLCKFDATFSATFSAIESIIVPNALATVWSLSLTYSF